ncbi:MAG: sulfotransferase family protein [Gemmatimonadales bacterium]
MTNRQMLKIAKPIIIVGTGRCGSTVFHRLLAKHPQLMWLSGFCDYYPTRPAWNRWAVTAMGNPVLGRLFGGKIQPGEAYRFWDKHTYGFSEPCRDLYRSDVTARVREQVRAALEPMLTAKRDRLLIKITGWPRIGFLNEIFEDAKFIHIVRDGRAVASSLLHVNFWRGWMGPQSWRAGLLSAEDQAVWESYDRSFVALAGLEWRIQMRAIEAARRVLDPKLFYEVRYEAFCQQPLETYRGVLEFAELRESRAFERQVEAASIKSTSNRWRNDLTRSQQSLLHGLLREDLLRYGYGDVMEAEKIRETAGR